MNHQGWEGSLSLRKRGNDNPPRDANLLQPTKGPRGCIPRCPGTTMCSYENSLPCEARSPSWPLAPEETKQGVSGLAQCAFLAFPPRSTLCEIPSQVIEWSSLFSAQIIYKPGKKSRCNSSDQKQQRWSQLWCQLFPLVLINQLGQVSLEAVWGLNLRKLFGQV